VREYIPLKRLTTGLNGLPITNEWRVFCYQDTVLCKGFYWASYPEAESQASWDPKADKLLKEIMSRVVDDVTFYVLDLAETLAGEWILIEINDGQMSGLGMCDPHTLYKNLRDTLCKLPESPAKSY
jgi:hypothetical protein